MKNKAFSLAEILITLTIIGVVAMLTVPNIVQDYKKQQVESVLKRSYASLSNAIRLSATEQGMSIFELINFYDGKPESFFKECILPHIKTVSTCIPNNSKCNVFKDKSFKDINGKNLQGMALYDPGASWSWVGAVLPDGMVLGVRPGVYDGFLFVVDINGKKGPNKIGHDIFYFSKRADDKPIFFGVGYHSWTYPGQAISQSHCVDSQEVVLAGTKCGYNILLNGWKIPKNYPVKKW